MPTSTVTQDGQEVPHKPQPIGPRPGDKPGQGIWRNLPPQVPTGYEAGSSLQDLPNYERLTGAERWIMNRLPGIPVPVQEALQRFSEGPLGKALMILDVGAEALERTTGFVAQFLASRGTPEQEEFDRNWREAWYAGSLAADAGDASLGSLTPYTAAGGVLGGIAGTLAGPGVGTGLGAWAGMALGTELGLGIRIATDGGESVAAMANARRRIDALVNSGMDIGEAMEQARGEMYTDMGALQLRAQLNDAWAHIFADPLNVIAMWLRPVGRIQDLAQAAEITTRRGGYVAEVTGQVADLERALERGEDVAEALSSARDALRVAEAMPDASPLQQMAMRVSGMIEWPEGSTARRFFDTGLGRFVARPFQLTPMARAHEYVSNSMRAVNALIADVGPVDAARMLRRGADGILDPRVAHMIATPAGRYLKANMTAMAAVAEDVAAGFSNPTLVPRRQLLQLVAAALGQDVHTVYRRLATEAPAVMDSAGRAIRSSPELTAMMQRYLTDFGFPEITVDMLRAARESFDTVFKSTGVHLYDEFLAGIGMRNRLIDVASQMAVAQFGLHGRGVLEAMSDALKAAESLAFLRANPGYPVRNWINNYMTMLRDGSFGTFSLRYADGLWKRIGFEPEQLRAGVGMGGIMEEGGAAALRTEAQLGREALSAAQRAGSGVGGWFERVRDRLSGVHLPVDFGRWAQQIERQSSMRAYTTGYLRTYSGAFRSFMPRVSEFAPELAEELGDDIARTIERAIPHAMNGDELDNVILTGNIRLAWGPIRDRASRILGSNIDDTLGEEFLTTIAEDLSRAAQRGPTAIRDAMAGIRNRVQNHIDDAVDRALQTMVDETETLVRLEGPGAIPRVYGYVIDDLNAAHQRHMVTMAGIRENSPDWAAILEGEQRVMNRAFLRAEARVQGLSDGVGSIFRNDPRAREMVTRFRQWRSTWDQFFASRNATLRGWFDNPEARTITWDALRTQINSQYDEAIAIEQRLMTEIDDAAATMMPPELQASYSQWRTLLADMRNYDRSLSAQWFRSIDGQPLETRSALYRAYWQQRMALNAQMYHVERMGIAALQGNPDAQAALFALSPAWRPAVEAGAVGPEGAAAIPRAVTEVPVAPDSQLGRLMAGGLSREEAEAELAQFAAEQMGEEFPTLGAEIVAETVQTTERAFVADAGTFVPRELYLGTGLDELWATRGEDVLNAIQQAALELRRERPIRFADLSPAAQGRLRGYLDHAHTVQAQARYAGMRGGEFTRDAALLNYNRRMNYDTWLGTMMPYEFWFTHSAFKWALHSIDRPAMAATYLRLRRFLDTAYRPESGLPDRLRGTVRINMPFMEPWMGGTMFTDPIRFALPLDQFFNPFDVIQREQASDAGAALRMLEQLRDDREISDQEYDQTIASQSGPVWERAMSLVRQDDSEGRFNVFDSLALFVTPHAPLMWAFTNQEEEGPFLPITRSIRTFTAGLGIGPPGGVNIEGNLRRALGLPEYDKWDDYRTDRMLSNMVADGDITLQQSREAMVERDGPIYEEAVRRAGVQFAGGGGLIPAAMRFFGVPAQGYPTGEEHQRELRNEYAAAWEQYDAGNRGAINEFFEAHPEYEARVDLGYWDKPEERIRRFLVDGLWERYNSLPDLNRREISEQLGTQFQQAFLDRETRNYAAVPAETLATWLRIMGGDPPGTLGANAVPMEMAPAAIAQRAQVFYNLRDMAFPDYRELQNDYFRLDEGGARRAFLSEHPRLRQYWNWRNDWMLRNPSVSEYLTDEPPTYPSESALREAEMAQPNFTAQEWRIMLGEPLWNLVGDYAAGEELPQAARDRISEMAEQLGVTQEDLLGRISSAQ